MDSIAARTRDFAEVGIENEIRQLRSLAKYADNGALKPIVGGEVFGAESEDRNRLFKRLINAATERGIQQEWASRKGLRATPRQYGYGRYIRLHENIVWFGVNLAQFENTGDTPLWVDCLSRLHGKPGEVLDELQIRDQHWAPVDLMRDAEYPQVLEGVVDNLRRIADALRGA